jgi:hypothetical protein
MASLQALLFQNPRTMSIAHKMATPSIVSPPYVCTKILQPDFRITLAKGKFSPGHVWPGSSLLGTAVPFGPNCE